jgi:hypothetical protein
MIKRELAKQKFFFDDRYQGIKYRITYSELDNAYKVNIKVELDPPLVAAVMGDLADPKHKLIIETMVQNIIEEK